MKHCIKSIISLLFLIALFAGGFWWAYQCGLDVGWQQKKANLYAEHILVSRKDPIGDLQRFFNSQGERYQCGEADSVPGPLFRRAAHNWICDRYNIEVFAKAENEK